MGGNQTGANTCRARKELAGIFSKVIQGRRAAGRSEHDLLQHFMDCRYKVAYGGRATTDEEISGMLIASLFAGQHTSSITSAWTGFFMLADKVNLCNLDFRCRSQLINLDLIPLLYLQKLSWTALSKSHSSPWNWNNRHAVGWGAGTG